MEYRFKSLFDREKEYVIETEEPLHLYNEFSISIRKVDKESKSFSVDNINNNFGLQYQETVPLFFPNATPCKKHWNSISIILFSSR